MKRILIPLFPLVLLFSQSCRPAEVSGIKLGYALTTHSSSLDLWSLCMDIKHTLNLNEHALADLIHFHGGGEISYNLGFILSEITYQGITGPSNPNYLLI